MFFEIDNMSAGYLEILDAVREEGRERSPRGMSTLEIPNVLIKLNDPHRAHPIGIGRDYGKAVVAAEALSLVGGVSDPQLMLACGSAFQRFMDGGALHGAYGPRIRGQLVNVVERLKADPDTRQAIIQVWDARYDQAGWNPKDLPCTLSLGFAIYDGKLEMNVVMRSNDVWLGVAHDVPMFTCLQHTVASALELQPGAYYHLAHSMHIYERDFPAIDDQVGRPGEHDPEAFDTIGLSPAWGVGCIGDIEEGVGRARLLLSGKMDTDDMTDCELRYYDQLADKIERVNAAKKFLTEANTAQPAILAETA